MTLLCFLQHKALFTAFEDAQIQEHDHQELVLYEMHLLDSTMKIEDNKIEV